MTTLALDYYRRTGDAERALRLPFSLFLTGDRGDRLVVTVHRARGGLKVRHWRLSGCRPGRALPPRDEFDLPAGTPLRNPATVLPGYTPLPYHIPDRFGQPAVGRLSARELAGHARDVRYYLDCDNHRRRRAWWLLEAFVGTYGERFCVRLARGADRTVDPGRLVSNDPRVCLLWGTWRSSLLDLPPRGRSVAAEVVFEDAYAAARGRPLGESVKDAPLWWHLRRRVD